MPRPDQRFSAAAAHAGAVRITPGRANRPLPDADLPVPAAGWTLRSSWQAAWAYADQTGHDKPETAAHYAWHALLQALDEAAPDGHSSVAAALVEEHYLDQIYDRPDFSRLETRP